MATLHWEKLAVPIRIDVDTPAVVVASLHSELRGLQGFSWQRLAQAADWCATNNVNLDEAGKWADQAVAQQENFQTLRAKAAVVERKGDAAAARDLRAKSMTVASEADINNYGYQLLGSGKVDEAIAAFRDNIKRHPDSWNTYDSLGEGARAQGRQGRGRGKLPEGARDDEGPEAEGSDHRDTLEALELGCLTPGWRVSGASG